FDGVLLQTPDQFAEARAGLGERRVGDDEVGSDNADSNRRKLLMERLQRLDQAVEIPRDQRGIRPVELRRAGAGGEWPDQPFVPGNAWRDLSHSVYPGRASSARAAARAPYEPCDETVRSASTAAGVPIRASEPAAASRTRRV